MGIFGGDLLDFVCVGGVVFGCDGDRGEELFVVV